MRISTSQIFQQGISAILEQQAQLQTTQRQLATGLRVTTPADDPVAAVQILDLSTGLSRLDRYQRNAELAMGALAREETVVQDAVDVIQRVRELLLQANNATQTAETRSSTADELRGLRERLVSLANTRDASGEYLFAGYDSSRQPFVENPGGVVFRGDEGGRELAVADGVQVAIRASGRELFMAVPAGNGSFAVAADAGNTGTAVLNSSSAGSDYQRDTYTLTFTQATPADPLTYSVVDGAGSTVASGNYTASSEIAFNGARLSFTGQPADGDSFSVGRASRESIFAALDGVIAGLEGVADTPASRASLNTLLAGGLGTVDGALGNFLERQTDLGSRMAQVESVAASNESFALGLQTTLSEVRDLDYAEAISRLQQQLTTLEAAQRSYVALQGLSLFDYL
ncbi:flagellar hook-associated protein FlgL [Haliea atlantica]